jgi:hypothetical protein
MPSCPSSPNPASTRTIKGSEISKDNVYHIDYPIDILLYTLWTIETGPNSDQSITWTHCYIHNEIFKQNQILIYQLLGLIWKSTRTHSEVFDQNLHSFWENPKITQKSCNQSAYCWIK